MLPEQLRKAKKEEPEKYPDLNWIWKCELCGYEFKVGKNKFETNGKFAALMKDSPTFKLLCRQCVNNPLHSIAIIVVESLEDYTKKLKSGFYHRKVQI